MSSYNSELNRELKEIEKDRVKYEIELEKQQEKISMMLKGEMGKDMHNVLDGKVKVKMPLIDKVKYKINYFLNKLFNTI